MGVKYLWGIIDPICVEKSCSELFGKRVAIDLACWVVSDNQILPAHIAKPHLRNLFFRTANLLDNGIDPVFVLEGQAPKLKAQVMERRREIRFGPSQGGTTVNTLKENCGNNRSRYKFIQKECSELLEALGVTFIESKGEAEAACAGLNQLGAVDGCITVDGDCFLYGAKTVYRNLSTDASNFVCQEYSSDLIESRLNLSRDKLIVMAILFGCDYLPDGVPGVRKDPAIRVLSTWENGQAQDIIKSWLFENYPEEIPPSRPAHCSQCKHPGSLRNHTKSGCFMCPGHVGCAQSGEACHCEWHKNEIRYEEISIRNKVIQLEGLKQDIVDIFDEFRNEIHLEQRGSSIQSWQMPSVSNFVDIATRKLKWEISYAVEKILPLLSRWVIINGKHCHDKDLPIQPLRVVKKRVKRGCPVYEVEWKFSMQTDKFHNSYPELFLSLEPQFLIESNFRYLLPQVVEKPLKKSRSRKKPKAIIEKEQQLDLVKMLKEMNLETNAELSPSGFTEDGVSPSSFLNLTPGSDDSAEISTIVNAICLRKKKSGRNHAECLKSKETKDAVSNDSSRQKEETCIVEKIKQMPETPHLNFSLNFSLGKFLEDKHDDETFQGLPGKLPPLQDLTSTPIKRSILMKKSENWDSFSTPPPLAARFSKLHL